MIDKGYIFIRIMALLILLFWILYYFDRRSERIKVQNKMVKK